MLKIEIIKNDLFLQLLKCLRKKPQIFQKSLSTFFFKLNLPFLNDKHIQDFLKNLILCFWDI